MSFGRNKTRPEKSAFIVGNGYEIYIPLSGILDIDAETQRLKKELAKNETELKRVSGKLNNKRFLDKAPQDVVDKEKKKKDEFESNIQKLKNNLELISTC